MTIYDMIPSMIAIKAHFDGKVFVPDEPVLLKPHQQVRITVEQIGPAASPPKTAKRTFLVQPDAIRSIEPDFDAHLGDEFWGIKDIK